MEKGTDGGVIGFVLLCFGLERWFSEVVYPWF